MKKLMFTTLPLCVVICLATTWMISAGPLTPPPGLISSTARFGARVEVESLPGNGAFAHVISQPGSYYLGSNLSVADSGGILIEANDVVLDLQGHTISGSGASTFGVATLPSTNVTVRNGTVRGFADVGVRVLCNGSLVQDILVSGNGTGIDASASSCKVIERCVAVGNNTGIHVGFDCTVRSCVARDNSGDGILGTFRVNIQRCNASNNGGFGISLAGGGDSLLRANTALGNSAGDYGSGGGSTELHNHGF